MGSRHWKGLPFMAMASRFVIKINQSMLVMNFSSRSGLHEVGDIVRRASVVCPPCLEKNWSGDSKVNFGTTSNK